MRQHYIHKRLFFLLPFYIMRYEKIALDAKHPKLQKMLKEYQEIEKCLEAEFLEDGKEKAYRDLMELILRISDYILRNQEEAKKGLGDVMGGKVLELESDRLIQKGLEQGLEQGLTQSVLALFRKGKTAEEIADLLDLTLEHVKKIQDQL